MISRLRSLASRTLVLAFSLGSFSFAQERPAGVPENATHFDGHWYLTVSEVKSPEDAAAACANSGGYLAIVNSPEEHEFLKTLLAEVPEDCYWLGGSRPLEQAWQWGDGTPIAPGTLALVSTSIAPLHIAIRTSRDQRDLAGVPALSDKFPISGFVCEWGNTQSFAPGKSDSQTAIGTAPTVIPEGHRSLLSVVGSKKDGSPVLAKILATNATLSITPSAISSSPYPTSGGGDLRIIVDGAEMDSDNANAANEVATLLRLRHGAGISGIITITSEGVEAESSLDPGTALVWAVLADALITNSEVDSKAILMGDINADGNTRSAGSATLRLSHLSGKSSRVALPQDDAHTLPDLLLSGKPEPVCGNSITTLSTLDEAIAFAKPNAASSAEISAARLADTEMRNLYATRSGDFLALLKHPSVQAKLDSIITATPNSASASVLKKAGLGQLPKTISLTGSSFFVNYLAGDILDCGNSYEPGLTLEGSEERIVKNITAIRLIRGKLDPKTVPYADSLITLGTALKGSEERIVKNITAIRLIRGKLDPKTVRYADSLITLGSALKDQLVQPANSAPGHKKFFEVITPLITTVRKEGALFSTEMLEN